ncbi:PAS domain S-box protein [Pedobacter xixiisoli]|uniref:PAS domain S-box-containing protein n=1 Tax=Pedobacter xixiisoli TaxID=1476464 RepID=A0A285ZRZ3_9SPHI|nr:PAS domain S-box protein [Pedobacter xixiisoli]SOD12421.1 PAS domain S-box-containing protein [Pedobacter xixiisoli]
MPGKELERLQAVDRFLKLKISREDELQEIVNYAAEVCEVPIAMITLIDADTQHIKYRVGSDLVQTSRADAFCDYTILGKEVLVIPDTGKDARFADHPYRNGATNIQFYAGATLTTVDGINLGSLCVVGHHPKQLSEMQQGILGILSKQVVHILEFEYSLDVLKKQFLESKANEIKLRALFESSNACHLLVGKEMDILYFNRTLAEFMLDKHGQKMEIGAPILNYVGPDFAESFGSNFHRSLGGEKITFEESLWHDGSEIWWQFDFSPAYDSSGAIIGVSYTASDISELKRTKEEGDSKNRALDRIALMQSHNIRGPLAAILGLVDIIDGAGVSEIAEEIRMLKRSAGELDDIIRRLVYQASFTDHRK